MQVHEFCPKATVQEKINTSTHKSVLLYDEIAKPGMALDC